MMFRISSLVFILLASNYLNAQISDTVNRTEPILYEKDFAPLNIKQMIHSMSPSLPDVLTLPPSNGYVFYQDLRWPAPQEPFKVHEIKINFTPKPTRPLFDHPLRASLLILGTVAGMLNHQVIGVDKELELRTIEGVFSRSTVPTSAREGNPNDK